MSRELCGHVKYVWTTKKYYRGFIRLYWSSHSIRTSRKKFKTASQADAYAFTWRSRVVRFVEHASQTKMELPA